MCGLRVKIVNKYEKRNATSIVISISVVKFFSDANNQLKNMEKLPNYDPATHPCIPALKGRGKSTRRRAIALLLLEFVPSPFQFLFSALNKQPIRLGIYR
jgi:hypothetical protein